MKKMSLLIPALLLLCALWSCEEKRPTANDVILTKLKKGVYLHTTYQQFEVHFYPANGLVYLTDEGAILIDTPWNDSQTKKLVELVRHKFKKEIKLAIATHYHHDNMGGVGYLTKAGIKLISTPLTQQLAAERSGLTIKHPEIDSETWHLKLGGKELEVYYPGPAHTIDNVAVWLKDEKLLFGGCAVKPLSAKGKGNIKEADLEKWPDTVMNLFKRYREAEIVVPGHGEPGGKSLLLHTFELIKREQG